MRLFYRKSTRESPGIEEANEVEATNETPNADQVADKLIEVDNRDGKPFTCIVR